MSIYTRVKQLIFGDTADASQFAQIGSESAGSPVKTKNLATMQSLSQYLAGLYGITGNGLELPRIEDFNSLFLLMTSQLAYLFQAGIPEYEATTNYYNLISFVQSGGVIYQSIAGTAGTPNVGNDPASSPTKWRVNDGYQESIRALAAEALKANLASPTFTGNVALPSVAVGIPAAADAIRKDYFLSCIPKQGLLLSNDGSAPNTVLDIAAGRVPDSTFTDLLILGSAFTKSVSAWAVGTGNGGLDTGSIAASKPYAVWLIKRPDTGVTDILFSLSATSPTMPTNYTLKRLIGSFFTDASGHIVACIWYPDDWIAITNPGVDITDATLTSTDKSYTPATVSFLSGIPVLVEGVGYISATTGYVHIHGNEQIAPATINQNNAQIASSSALSASGTFSIIAKDGKIYAKANGALTSFIVSIFKFRILGL